ncbi:metallothionein-3 [Drosophila montana]|uniref:metallothionein-3 n=1 Tax=Drosophila montana TaxID=40370 RepID=UPI00313C4F2F
MPCVGCEKECNCTAEKCSESCKCNSPGKCGCNPSKSAKTSSGGCCKKVEGDGENKEEHECCKNAKN